MEPYTDATRHMLSVAQLASGCQAQAECTCRIGALRDAISRAFQRVSSKDLRNGRNRFVARSDLLELFTPDFVLILLRAFLGPLQEIFSAELHEQNLGRIQQYICLSGPSRCCREASCTGARGIFGTLILVGKEDQIVKFCNAGYCDFRFRDFWDDEGGLTANTGFAAIAKEWSVSERDIFLQQHWQMRSPYFDARPGVMTLPSEVSLPLIEQEYLPKQLDKLGQFLNLTRIKLHPSHHNLGSIAEVFALKTTMKTMEPKMAEKSFTREIEAYKRIARGHERVVPLLAAFRFQDEDSPRCLIFPWASGGNLYELWHRHPTPASQSWCSTKWFMDECIGIADGLAFIHGQFNTSPGQPAPIPQLHADIKPLNILCFGNGPYRLKIADFGLSLPLDGSGRVKTKDIMASLTYRPPDKERHFGIETVSSKWDIWCFACVLLEFATWKLSGFQAVDDFRERRIQELEDPRATSERHMEEDTFFKKDPDSIHFPLALRHCPPKIVPQVKLSVLQQFQQLISHEDASAGLRRLLGYIEGSMLLVSDSSRATSREVADSLRDLMQEDAGNNGHAV